MILTTDNMAPSPLYCIKTVSNFSPCSRLPVVPQQPEYKPGLSGAVEDGPAERPLPHPRQRRSPQHTQGL